MSDWQHNPHHPNPKPAPQPAGSWVPGADGNLHWWDGYKYTGHTMPGPGQDSDRTIRTVVGVVVALLVIIGAVLNLQSVNLLEGSDKVWTGAALAAAAFVLCWVPKRLSGAIIVVVGIAAAALIANGVYVEVQLEHKRDELRNVLNSP